MNSIKNQKNISAVVWFALVPGMLLLLFSFAINLISNYAFAQESELESGTFTRVSRDLLAPVVYIDDEELFEDEYIVVSEGVPGTIVRTYDSIGENTAILVGEEAIIEPVSKIVRTGTRERLSTGVYIHPAKGIVTSKFGYRNVAIGSSSHKGWDISNATGTTIVAADGGTVIISGVYTDYSGYGKVVVIEHDNGDLTLYAHNSELLVEEGAIVAQGDEIARMGSTGTASGVHVHFEYRPEGGAAADPDAFFDEEDFTKE